VHVCSHGQGLTYQNHKKPGNIEDIGREAGRYVVHIILLPRLVLYHVEEDVYGRVGVLGSRTISDGRSRWFGTTVRLEQDTHRTGTRSTVPFRPAASSTPCSPSLFVLPYN
jgi:hypothetical protein